MIVKHSFYLNKKDIEYKEIWYFVKFQDSNTINTYY